LYNILICYRGKYPTRTTILDHLYSFERYSSQRCFYLNLATEKLSGYLLQIPFDLIIFHTNFLSSRWQLETFKTLTNKVRPLKNSTAVKIALPQDEFYCTDVVCDFINEFGIDHVFSVTPPSEWKKIYKTVDFSKVKFHPVLTGYLEQHTLKRIDQMAKAVRDRDLIIGYRAWRAEPWLGRHGYLKTQLAEIFQRESAAKGITADISTRAEDTLHGDAWYEFLLRCQYTIGVEGGASILDSDGSIRERTDRYVAQHPGAEFEEVEAACFPGLDGSLELFAISPRHLEACATKTCQILIEGNYNGVLTPGKHYIELRRDFSNLDEVFVQLEDVALRKKIVDLAFQDVVESGTYSYEGFVRQVLQISLGTSPENATSQNGGFGVWLAWQSRRLADAFSWFKAAFRGLIVSPLYQRAMVTLPAPLVSSLLAFSRKRSHK
jgi:hypothetical protein